MLLLLAIIVTPVLAIMGLFLGVTYLIQRASAAADRRMIESAWPRAAEMIKCSYVPIEGTWSRRTGGVIKGKIGSVEIFVDRLYVGTKVRVATLNAPAVTAFSGTSTKIFTRVTAVAEGAPVASERQLNAADVASIAPDLSSVAFESKNGGVFATKAGVVGDPELLARMVNAAVALALRS